MGVALVSHQSLLQDVDGGELDEQPNAARQGVHLEAHVEKAAVDEYDNADGHGELIDDADILPWNKICTVQKCNAGGVRKVNCKAKKACQLVHFEGGQVRNGESSRRQQVYDGEAEVALSAVVLRLDDIEVAAEQEEAERQKNHQDIL